MLESYNDVVTLDELCKILRICKNTAYKYLRSGEIKYRKIGRKIYIPKESIIHFLKFNK